MPLYLIGKTMTLDSNPLVTLNDIGFPERKSNPLGYYERTRKTLYKITLQSLIKSRKSLNECISLKKRTLSKSKLEKLNELNARIVVNKAALEKVQAKLSPLASELKALRNDLIPKTGLMDKLFKATEIRPSSKVRIDEIRKSITDWEKLKYKLSQEVRFDLYEIQSIELLEKTIQHTDKIIEIRIEKLTLEEFAKSKKAQEEKQRKANEMKRIREQKNKKLKSLRVKLASSRGAKRKLLGEVKKTVKRNRKCPYCFIKLDLFTEIHLDHIYPMSKGGQEDEANLVFACGDCNLNKSDLTLREFIKKFKLNREKIEGELERLGKSF
jgi:uncharacterized coiled-coil protein SlyX